MVQREIRYFFPLHYDAGNRGCEAIAKGTAILLGQERETLIAYCRDVELDTKLGVDKYVTLQPYTKPSYLIDRFWAALNKLFHTNTTLKWRLLYLYRAFLEQMSREDVLLSTGGDMMCYGNNEIIYTNDYVHSKGCRTILWGCSMGPENLTPEKLKSLQNYSLIYARESLTYHFMKELGLKNVCLCPDPAFILFPEECCLPQCFSDGDVLGINLSSYVLKGGDMNGAFAQEVDKLITYVLSHTSMHILMIPHVTWKTVSENQDDRELSRVFCSKYNSNRITMLDIDGLNYCQIRYVISKCRFFIGARTHAVISAYSVCVPTIALGYSIKSKGIAKDLDINEILVVDSNNPQSWNLMNSFEYLMQYEDSIRKKLELTMPDYCSKAYAIRDVLKGMNL